MAEYVSFYQSNMARVAIGNQRGILNW